MEVIMGQAEERAKQLVATLIPSSSPCPEFPGIPRVKIETRQLLWELVRTYMRRYDYTRREAIMSIKADLRDIERLE